MPLRDPIANRLQARLWYERKHPGCPPYRPTGRVGGPAGPRGERPGTAEKRAARAAEKAELALRKRRAHWLFLANQIPGCLEPKRCKTGHWVRPEEYVASSRMCRSCRRAKYKAWLEKNPDKKRVMKRAAKHRRRARKAHAGGTFTPSDWQRILDAAEGRCARCGSTEDPVPDHIISLSKGGSNDWTNIQVLCHLCNSRKGATITGAVQACIPGVLTYVPR